MPGRTYTSGSGYRYGFNGKENDNEVKGEGNQQDYGMRIYDPRLGRFLSVDPLTKEYPWYTPYQFAGNTPIQAVDLDGAEPTYPLTIQESFGRNGISRKAINADETERLSQKTRQTFSGSDVVSMLAFHELNSEKNRAPGYPSVELNDQKKGYYNCINSQITAIRILYDNFKFPASSSMTSFLGQLAKRNLASKDIAFDVYVTNETGQKQKVNGQFLDKKPDAIDDVASKFISMSSEVGLHVFGVALADGYHSVLVTVYNNGKDFEFRVSEQTSLTNGNTGPLTAEGLNNKLLSILGHEMVQDPTTQKWFLPVDSNGDGVAERDSNGDAKRAKTTTHARKLLNENSDASTTKKP